MAHGTCSICGRDGRIHLGMCVGHYTRFKRTGDPGPVEVAPVRVVIPQGSICSISTCPEPMHCRTWCKAHYSRWQKTGDVRADVPIRREPKPKPPPKPKPEPRFCAAPDCDEPYYIGGYCTRHDYHVKRYGDPNGGPCRLSDLVRQTRQLPLVERFWARVDKNGPVPAERPGLGPCWIWLAGRNSTGYGQFVGIPEAGQLAHRVAWFLSGRPLIAGLELDHLCRTEACVRPDHADQVPKIVNIMRGNGYSARNARKTHCSNGHEFTPDNTWLNPAGHRKCLACGRARHAAERAGLSRADQDISAGYREAIATDPCHYCGAAGEQVDHYFPVAKGGNDRWNNLVAACFGCNNRKSANCGTWFRLRMGSPAGSSVGRAA